MNAQLFSPIRVGRHTLKNRLVMAAGWVTARAPSGVSMIFRPPRILIRSEEGLLNDRPQWA